MNQWGHKKSQFFQFFFELRKIGNTISAYIKKTIFFIFFINEKKLGSPTRAKFIYPKSLCKSGKNLESLKVYRSEQHLKISILNLWMKREKLGSNSSFTVKNKTGNLHKIRLLTFQI